MTSIRSLTLCLLLLVACGCGNRTETLGEGGSVKSTSAESGQAGAKAVEVREDNGQKMAAVEVWEDNGLKMAFVWCPPGEFTIGSPKSEADRGADEDQWPVTLTKGFWLGRMEVTQGQWKSVMGMEPWKGEVNVKEGADYPATFVNWDDAMAFCAKLTEQERTAGRLGPDEAYRLPTEAEWEYACRAGTTTAYSFGDDASRLSDHAWWGGLLGDGNAAEETYAHAVASKKPNAWGLFDMHGNVWEWCGDWDGWILPRGRDPVGAPRGLYRVVRSGSWNSSAEQCRSAKRISSLPRFRGSWHGFRVARSSGRSDSPPEAERQ